MRATEKLNLIESKQHGVAIAVGFVNRAKAQLKIDKDRDLDLDSAKKLLTTQRKILAKRRRELKKLEGAQTK